MPSNLIELPPIKETKKDFEDLEAELRKHWRATLFAPLLKELGLPQSTLKNAAMAGNALLEALNSGRVTFNRGVFSGKFNSDVSRDLRTLGARWDKKSSTYKIGLNDLPIEVRHAVSASEFRFKQTLSRIDAKLAKLVPAEIADSLQVSKFFDASLFKVDKDFRKNVEKITVAPQLSPEGRKKIADEWQNNMRLWVKDWTESEITKLRKDVQKAVFAGDRHGSMIKTIQKSFGVSADKAKFLARQETGLLMAKFKETRYTEAGINEYRWGCVHMPHDKNPAQHTPGNVRYSHGILEDKIFRWDNPKEVDDFGRLKPNGVSKPGNGLNPGQDYNCRCFARPVLRRQKG